MKKRLSQIRDDAPFMIERDQINSYTQSIGGHPNIEIKESDLYYDCEFPVPGYSLEGIEIKTKRKKLIIKGKKEEDLDYDDNGYIRKEHKIETFQREFEFDFLADNENITAELQEGILKFRIYHR